MKLIILAGGFGTRLKSVVGDLPKILAPIKSRPFLYHQIENWKKNNLFDYFFLLHYQSNQIINFLENERSGILNKCNFNFCVEKIPLGTGGSLMSIKNFLPQDDDFLLINGDTWIIDGFEAIISSSAPSILVSKVANSSRFGSVEFDHDNYVIDFKEKKEIDGFAWVNSGLCKLNVRNLKGENSTQCSIEEGVFKDLIKKRQLMAVQSNSQFIDIGIPDDFISFKSLF
jgi:D-glycero-alpha-D-manno-heptose 1-phosphate guanylyltransferase